MKTARIFGLIILITFIGYNSQGQTKPLRHVVSFKFKPEATTDQINNLIADFEDLKNKIPQIQAFEWGKNNSPEGLDKGMTHCFILTFKDEADRDVYLPHPDHQAFGDKNGVIIEDVFVIDYYIE